MRRPDALRPVGGLRSTLTASVASYPCAVFKSMVAVALVVAAAWFGYQELRDADPEQLPTPTQVVVPTPDITFDVPNPVP